MRGRGGRGGGGWRRTREENDNLEGAESEDEELVRMEEEEEEDEREEEEMEDDEEDELEMGYEEEEEDVNVEDKERERKEESLQEQPPPKLDEGFYEIEDVRKRRVRKGQIQYLIKWRGWPETANTWEPMENLQSCSDVIDAFEESLKSGKSRRHKRKSGGSLSQPKKKQQTSSSTGSKVGRRPGALSSAFIDNSTSSSLRRSYRIDGIKSVNSKDHGNGESKNEDGKILDTTAHQTENENGSSNIFPQDEQNKGEIDDPKLTELKGTDPLNPENMKLSINFSDTRVSEKDGLTDGVSKADFGEPVPTNRFTGARRRKSGCVRRFKNDLASLEPDEAQNGNSRSTVEFGDKLETIRVEDGEVPMRGDAIDKNKLENSINWPPITKIIKTISYSASILNNVQDVSVTFVAMRADGKEVVVDNKFLKANNPQLLISFYEQHVRYSSLA